MILLDTSGLLAALDAAQRQHEAARRAIEEDRGPFVLSPFVLAELDYLLSTRVGVHAELALLREVARGAYLLAPFDDADIGQAIGVLARYRDLNLGLADASIVVLAARFGCDRILTLDERHFRAIRSLEDRAFRLLPADA